uniref:Type I inositol polyphosphate 5-phosphatase 1-like isoform X2 n=1 Tax=Nicotiana tabacum TaxID=4097 RepID=A0A1S3XIN3_TOBAC|nr:PREDICTED: type I inositol polyphosphate 5-phosphatase 1-like isoform X2 [Nicotiana tabacum]
MWTPLENESKEKLKKKTIRIFSELFWPRVVMRKWLNISAKDSDYSADPDSDSGSGSDTEQELCEWPRQSRLNDAKGIQVDINDALPRIRRRKSETFRAQYINTKKLRVCVGTWNVAGNFPSEDLELDSWLDVNELADIYVIGKASLFVCDVQKFNLRMNSGVHCSSHNICSAKSNRKIFALACHQQLLSCFSFLGVVGGGSNNPLLMSNVKEMLLNF